MKNYILSLATVLVLAGCASKNDEALERSLLTAQRIEVYDITPEKMQQDSGSGRALLKSFPFVANQTAIGYQGKFSDQFYEQINLKYQSAALKNVDFWKLRSNPMAEDFIYMLPVWAKQFKKISNNLFEDLGYSNNLSSKEQEILQWWISQGGILWINGGIYSTRYDTFTKDGAIDSRSITDTINQKSSKLSFFDKEVKAYLYQSKIVDVINFEPLNITFKTKSNIPYFKDIKNLQITTDNYLTADFMPKGSVLLESEDGAPLVVFVQSGKGGAVFLRPFEFQDKMYDGELLRWKILHYLMTKLYLKTSELKEKRADISLIEDKTSVVPQKIEKKEITIPVVPQKIEKKEIAIPVVAQVADLSKNNSSIASIHNQIVTNQTDRLKNTKNSVLDIKQTATINIKNSIEQNNNSLSLEERLDQGVPVTVHDIRYNAGSYVMFQLSVSKIKPIIDYMKAHLNAHLTIGSYTDSAASKEYNHGLAASFANSVQNEFVRMGVDINRINLINYGNDTPLMDSKLEGARAYNRRINFTITKE